MTVEKKNQNMSWGNIKSNRYPAELQEEVKARNPQVYRKYFFLLLCDLSAEQDPRKQNFQMETENRNGHGRRHTGDD